MNRTIPTDSKLSLDERTSIDDSIIMLAQPYHLYIERTDVTNNMARFYALEIAMTLFGEACLIRRWGRIGTRGQERLHPFEREDEAVKLFLDLARQKRTRGYRPRASAMTR